MNLLRTIRLLPFMGDTVMLQSLTLNCGIWYLVKHVYPWFASIFTF
jgi:hypothetical protein